MTLIRLLGPRRKTIRILYKGPSHLLRAKSKSFGERWQSNIPSQVEEHSSNNLLSQEHQKLQDIKRDVSEKRCFSLLSDFSQPIVSRPHTNELPTRAVRSGETPLVVFLITPSHLNLIDADSRFVPDLLYSTHHGIEIAHEIDVLVAVVDGISFPVWTTESGQKSDPYKKWLGYTGNGISVLFLDSDAAPNLWSDRKITNQRGNSIVDARGSLSFCFPTELEPERRRESGGPHYLSKTIKLPVANTIFQNGRQSTIQAQRWRLSEATPEPSFTCMRVKWLDEQVLQLRKIERIMKQLSTGSLRAEERLSQWLQIAVPLQPITPPRVISAAMGNVIRSIYSIGSSGKSVPASRELESAINGWISEHGNGTRLVDVWALIEPHSAQLRSDASGIQDALKAGVRLHKLTGGGGGWGNRQGLLTIDPNMDFDVLSKLSPALEEDNGDLATEAYRNLDSVVSHGDIVEFFVRKPSSIEPVTPHPQDSSWEFSQPNSFNFGTTPSTIDVLPTPSTKAEDESIYAPCIYAWGHFGMFSEQGMSFSTDTVDGQIQQTKIDVPYSSISLGAPRHLPAIVRHHFPRSQVDSDR